MLVPLYRKFSNIGNKTGTIKSVSGRQTINLPRYAPFIPLADRVLKTYEVDEFNKVEDSEAKILELILNDVFVDGDTGTIRLVSTNPVCDSCGQVIEDFIEIVKARGGDITVEVIEIRTPR